MVQTQLHYLSIHVAGKLMRERQISPVELTQACLDRIDALDGHLHCYITVTRERALVEARTAEREMREGTDRGPLHGIPYALKDLFWTKGVRTTAHSEVLVDWVPQEDAAVVRRLREGGAALLGKQALSEFAHGGPFDGPFPPARSPWDFDRSPGSSSSGSGAAVAAGLCFAALGSDTGGSIRWPAAACGIVGLKPTYGRVSRFGLVPYSWSKDTVGPLTRTVEDAAAMLQVIAGHDPQDPTSSTRPPPDYVKSLAGGIKGLRVGLVRHLYASPQQTEPDILALVDHAALELENLGARLEEVVIPSAEHAVAATAVIHGAESFACYREDICRRPADFGPSVRDALRLGALYTADEYLLAQRVRALLVAEMTRAFEQVDVLLTPTLALTTPRLAEYTREGATGRAHYRRLFALTGFPAMSVPCGFTTDGLPVGLQLAGRPYEEGIVLQAAYAYQEANSWHLRHPPL